MGGLPRRARPSCAGPAGWPERVVLRESLGDEPVTEQRASGGRGGRRPAGLYADRRADRPQRSVLVRIGRQVQEVPRPLSGGSSRSSRPRRSSWRARASASSPSATPPYRIWDQGRPRRAPAGGRHRRHGRGPVRRPAVAVLRGPARPRHRPLPRGVAPQPDRDRRQAEGDRTTEAASAREYVLGTGRAARTRSWPRTQPDDARVDPRRRRVHARPRPADRGLRVRPDPHAAGPADGADDGHRPPAARRPGRARSSATRSGRIDAIVHELGALAVYFVPAERRPCKAPRTTHPEIPSWRWGIGLVYCAKTRRSRTARVPGRSLPAQPLVPSVANGGSP